MVTSADKRRQSTDMELQEDAIVDISEAREKFFGCSGKMLLPSRATVAAQLAKLPADKLITVDVLEKMLAQQFNVEVTCPVTTKKALQAIARDANNDVAYWHVIKKTGELFAIFPGGVQGQASRLRDEGFTIDANGKAPKVSAFKDSVISFE